VSKYSLSHLSDQTLLHDLATLVARDRATTAELLAHIAEVDARKLYLPAAFPSMYAYCVGELRLSEEAAFKRIHAARAARLFPAILVALADGRLHLSAVVMLAPHLTQETADELLAAAEHKTKSEIEKLLADRFPRPDLPVLVCAISAPDAQQHAPGRVESSVQHAPGRVEACERARVAPLAPQRYALQLTMSQSTHDKLRYAQDLLGHQVAPGDVAQVLDRALDALIAQLEKRKFAATSQPRHHGHRPVPQDRHVPAEVRRAVWERDGGRCTFVGECGQRCAARSMVEFDHVQELARGGVATIGGMRLRCRAHNQYTAERTYGAEFMRHKREQARCAAAARRAKVATDPPEEQDVAPWLRQLGFSHQEASRAAGHCEGMTDASLEERVRAALTFLAPRCARRAPTHEIPRTV